MSDVPVALCQIVMDVLKDLTNMPIPDEVETVLTDTDENEISERNKIEGIDLSESSLGNI